MINSWSKHIVISNVGACQCCLLISSSIFFDCVSILDTGLVLASKGYSRSVIACVRYCCLHVTTSGESLCQNEGDPEEQKGVCCWEILICITMLDLPRAFCRCNCFTETMLQCLNEKPDSSGIKHVCVKSYCVTVEGAAVICAA